MIVNKFTIPLHRHLSLWPLPLNLNPVCDVSTVISTDPCTQQGSIGCCADFSSHIKARQSCFVKMILSSDQSVIQRSTFTDHTSPEFCDD